MLDIHFIRANPETVRSNLAKRQDNEILVLFDSLLKKDAELRELLNKINYLRKKRNDLTKQVDEAKRANENFQEFIGGARKVSEEIRELDQKRRELQEAVHLALMRLPNLLDNSVPFGKDEEGNKVLKKTGKPKKFDFPLIHHGVLAEKLNCIDFERAVKISGAGFYFLKNELALMDQAILQFSFSYLMKKGFEFIETPLLMRRSPYEGTTDLNDFENVMYKIEGEDLYLIATSEHPLIAMHGNEIFDEKDLPIKYVGLSPCFRKEVGKHSIDERGLFRVHQFNKTEQIVFCKPQDSEKFFNEILKNAEQFMKELEIPYRLVSVCTGDIGIVASRKVDIEGWSPREKKYIELMSCSDCKSFQAVRSNIKFRKKDGSKEFVHTLNNTAIAAPRLLRLILENHQTRKGTVVVPKALRPFMNKLKEIKPKQK